MPLQLPLQSINNVAMKFSSPSLESGISLALSIGLVAGCSAAPRGAVESTRSGGVTPSATAAPNIPSTDGSIDYCAALKQVGIQYDKMKTGEAPADVARRAKVELGALTRFDEAMLGMVGVSGAVKKNSCVALPKSAVHKLTPSYQASMQGVTWRRGCLDSPDTLRDITVPYIDFEGSSRVGHIVMAEAVAHEIGDIFDRMYALSFPVQSIDRLEDITPDALKTASAVEAEQIDTNSMERNNTSAFNCRIVVGTKPYIISNHGLGRAIDINPVQNPFIYENGTKIGPAASREYLDRENARPGMLTYADKTGAAVIKLFTDRGWKWGGAIAGPDKDWQHFYKPNGPNPPYRP